jgi:hypothetical protein
MSVKITIISHTRRWRWMRRTNSLGIEVYSLGVLFGFKSYISTFLDLLCGRALRLWDRNAIGWRGTGRGYWGALI